MRSALNRVLPLALILLAAFAIGACSGSEEHLEVPEGEPVSLEGVHYNVVITRFLNPDLVDDASYLGEYAEWPGADKLLMGVFVQMHNESGETITVPEGLTVIDTQDRRYTPESISNDFTLPIGDELEDGARLPVVDSPAFYGPIQGSMVLYEIDTQSVENRPLILEIPTQPGGGDHNAYIELDI